MVVCLVRQRCVGWGVCICTRSFSVVQCRMLAPMLLHLYSEEVRSKFCCPIPQLIANRLSVTLRHTASHGRPERTSNATTLKRYVNETKKRVLKKMTEVSKLGITHFPPTVHVTENTYAPVRIFSCSPHL